MKEKKQLEQRGIRVSEVTVDGPYAQCIICVHEHVLESIVLYNPHTVRKQPQVKIIFDI